MKFSGFSACALFLPLLASCFYAAGKPETQEGFWNINDVEIKYRMVGRGEPLILLHGGPGGNYLAFRKLEGKLPGYKLIMYDQRGSGDSERLKINPMKPDTSLISVEKHVEDLEEIRKKLGLEKMNLLGHSWGGTLAVFYAAKYPQRIKSLIVYNGGPVWKELSAKRRKAMFERLSPEKKREVSRLLSDLKKNLGVWNQAKLDEWFVETAECYFPALVCDSSTDTDGGNPGRGGFWANQLTNRYVAGFDRIAFAEKLKNVSAPVLLTYGECEPTPIERQEYLLESFPNAELHVFRNSGHQALDEETESFIKTVSDFLAGI